MRDVGLRLTSSAISAPADENFARPLGPIAVELEVGEWMRRPSMAAMVASVVAPLPGTPRLQPWTWIGCGSPAGHGVGERDQDLRAASRRSAGQSRRGRAGGLIFECGDAARVDDLDRQRLVRAASRRRSRRCACSLARPPSMPRKNRRCRAARRRLCRAAARRPSPGGPVAHWPAASPARRPWCSPAGVGVAGGEGATGCAWPTAAAASRQPAAWTCSDAPRASACGRCSPCRRRCGCAGRYRRACDAAARRRTRRSAARPAGASTIRPPRSRGRARRRRRP